MVSLLPVFLGDVSFLQLAASPFISFPVSFTTSHCPPKLSAMGLFLYVFLGGEMFLKLKSKKRLSLDD